jgi:YVTN family beta-propeller protein
MSHWRIKRILGQVSLVRALLTAITCLIMTCLPHGYSEHRPLLSNSVGEENIRLANGKTVDAMTSEKQRPTAQTRIRSNLKAAVLDTLLDHGADANGYVSTTSLQHDGKVITGKQFSLGADNALYTNGTLDGSGYGLTTTWWQGCSSTPFTGGTYDCERRLNYGTFTLNSPAKLSAVHVWIGGFNNWALPGEPYLKMEIYLGDPTSSATSSALLATSYQTLTPNSYPTGAERTFTFANSVALSAGTPYTIRLFVLSGTRGDLGSSGAFVLYGTTLTQQSAAYSYTSLIESDSDTTALDTRTPLILIHGIHGVCNTFSSCANAASPPKDSLSWFGNLIKYFRNAGITTSYKIYRFSYDSDIYTARQIAEALRGRIDERSEFRDKKLVLIAHSMGGIIARHYLTLTTTSGTYVNQPAGHRVLKLITLATPHHGTQLANGDARAGLLQFNSSVTNVLKTLDVVYWGALNGCPLCALLLQHPNRGTLLWDNFDGSWNYNPSYRLSPSEQNQDLPQFDPFNFKIIAYYGTVSTSDNAWQTAKQVAHDGVDALRKLVAKKRPSLRASDLALNALSLLLQGIKIANLSDLRNIVPQNDGYVPVESGRFDCSGIACSSIKRVRCRGYNHRQMVEGMDGADRVCEETGKNLFASITADLVSISGNAAFITSNAAFITSSGLTTGLLLGPQQEEFGYEVYGNSNSSIDRDHAISLTNHGDASVQVSSVSLTGDNPNQFSVVSVPPAPFTIPAHASVEVTVRFSPTSTGLKSAILTAVNNSSNSAVSVPLEGFGMPSSCDVTFSPESRYMPVQGGSGSFTIPNISCPWSVSTNDSWIHPTAIGNTVNFTVDSNSTGATRGGSIAVSIYDRVYSFNVQQESSSSGCMLSLSSSSQNFGSSGGSGSFNVITPDNCGWGFQSGSPWITANNQGIRQGSSLVSFTVAPNTASSLRIGTIIVEGQDATHVFTVTQDAGSGSCAYSLQPSSEQIMPAAGGQNSFTISAGQGCPWQISSPDRWITFNSHNNGIGSETISYNAAVNPSTSVRLGSISIQAGSSTLLLTVSQNGQPVVYPSIGLPTSSFQMGDALLNTTTYQGVVIGNSGPGYLFLGSIYRSSGSTDFDILPYGENQIIAPGGTTSVTIKLTPTSTGSRNATFTVTSNDPSNPSINFSVSGNGVAQLTGGIDFVWGNKSTIPSQASISSLTGVTINNIIYVVGGAGGGDYKYDPTNNSWSEIAPRPFGQFGSADVVNGKIYSVTYDGFSSATRGLIYNPTTNGWNTGATMPALRLDMAVAAANGKVYAFSGRSGTGADPATSSVYEYNPSTDTWATKANMPTARMGAVAITWNGLIYVIGGLNGSQKLQTVEVYNPVNDTWATRERMPSPRAWASAFILNSKIYVAGGIGNFLGQGGNDRYDLVEEFDPSKPDSSIPGVLNAWAVRNHLITGRASCATGVVNNKAYVMGGFNSGGAGVYSIEEGVLAASPKINLPIASASFGDVYSGSIGEKGIEVQNLGNALLTVSASRISGSDDFRLFRSTGSIDQGQSFTFKIRFTPSSTGSKSATFRITSNDPNTPTVDVTVFGNGIAAPSQTGTWQVVNSIPITDNNGQPVRLAISNGKAYVTRANGSGGALTVLDLSTNAVVGNITMNAYPGGQPGYVTVSGNRAYLALRNLFPNGQLAVINTDNNSLLTFIPVGTEPFGVGFVGSKGYVSNSVNFSNGDPATVTVVDANSNTVTKTITVGRSPTQVVTDAGSGKAYVTNSGGSTPEADSANPLKSLSVIDTATDTVMATIPMPYSPSTVALAGNHAYVCTGATVEIVDLSSNSVTASIPIPDNSYGIAATRDNVLVLNSSQVTVISLASNSVVGTIGINSPGSITVDPATNLVYVTKPNDQAISVLRLVAPAFSISTNSQSLAAAAGGNTTFKTTVTSIDGFSRAVNLSCEGLPTGATCQFGQNPVNVPANGSISITLTLSVPAGTISGPYSLRVVGTGSVPQNATTNSKVVSVSADTTTLTDFQNLSLTVPTCDFTLSAQYASVGTGTTTGSVDVGCTTGCPWTAVSNDTWISINTGANGSSNGTVGYSVTANPNQDSRIGTMTIAGRTFTVIQSGTSSSLGIINVNPMAGRSSGGQQINLTGAFINLSNVTIGGVTAQWSYTNGAGDTSQITVTTPAHAVGVVTIDLVPTSGSTYSKSNAFAYLPIVFTDDTLVAGVTTAKAQHIIELRHAVDALRAVAKLTPAQWTDATLVPTSTMIKVVHILELRMYLDEAMTHLGYSTQPYTDPSLNIGDVIKRVHIEELRQRIRAIAG